MQFDSRIESYETENEMRMLDSRHKPRSTIGSFMTKILLLTVLCLSVLSMTPIMGSHHMASDHLDHDASASCAACMGTATLTIFDFFLALLGLSNLILPSPPRLALIVDRFQPPRVR